MITEQHSINKILKAFKIWVDFSFYPKQASKKITHSYNENEPDLLRIHNYSPPNLQESQGRKASKCPKSRKRQNQNVCFCLCWTTGKKNSTRIGVIFINEDRAWADTTVWNPFRPQKLRLAPFDRLFLCEPHWALTLFLGEGQHYALSPQVQLGLGVGQEGQDSHIPMTAQVRPKAEAVFCWRLLTTLLSILLVSYKITSLE